MAGIKKGKTSKATIQDVARVAGVSVTTVSRVLNKEPHVREKKRIAVQDAVAKLQYSPSMYARSLAAGRSRQVGLAFYDPSGDYVSGLLQGALQECADSGFHLLVEQLMDENYVRRLDDFVKQVKLDGMVLAPPLCDDKQVLDTLARHDIFTVRIAPGFVSDGTVGISIDDHGAAFAMTEHLIERGHRRIGFIKGPELHISAHNRYQGYSEALEKHGIALDEELVRQGDFHFSSGRSCCMELLSLSDRPTAIFASNDDMAAGVSAVAHEMDIDLPSELAVSGFDDIGLARMIWPALTTVHQPVLAMAKAAVRRVIAHRSADPEERAEHGLDNDIQLDYKLVIRTSTETPQTSG